MRTYLPALVAAALFAGTASASEAWTDIPTSSLPLATGTVVADAGGDSAPVFGAGGARYDAVASAAAVMVVSTGDSYDVTPRAFLGSTAEAPRAVAGLARQPGGG